ncbi:hypothetical protein GUITHDRAFT_163170 [Guillardia theta CCMP2712]|uniref:Methyltransferase domain-containing protein n=1 Tax=Guillardia theta (strain CCMP2712) TaxID=905079 RepID=L1JBM4_GUITC|nr:hypothetical protein GUITHDRAFT_163170 [Guillardia theta CCMP2712]EKX45911.1 hypothetical protein GUITHDRAFT_163170 [Guillardia theta CCMP2712]|eukprot:XP_005832891.1 hypothetical protein GUITHDRAFT_163170 [Guillardia theta CCMP2712]
MAGFLRQSASAFGARCLRGRWRNFTSTSDGSDGAKYAEHRETPLSRWTVSGERPDRALAFPQYWDAFYKSKESEDPGSLYDWYSNSDVLQGVLWNKLRRLQAGHLVLHAGCGTSALSLALSSHFKDIRFIHADFSMQGLELMKHRHPELNWMAMDVRQLPFADRSLAAVVEKGTMDALLRKGDDAWLDMCKECSRALSQGGIFLQITDEPPELRLPLLEHLREWQVSFSAVDANDDGYEYFVYSCEMR